MVNNPLVRNLLNCLWVVLLLASCGDDADRFADKARVMAPARISDSFALEEKYQTPLIRIRQDALEKEFLLQSSFIEQTVAAMGSALKSRIVAFRKKNHRLYMLEATDGHLVTDDLPSKLVLADFLVIEENKDSLVFDFNSGMRTILLSDDWRGQDGTGAKYSSSFSGIPLHTSFIDVASMSTGNRLSIRQVAQIAAPSDGSTDYSTIEIRYFLSPYMPDPSYKPLASQGMKLFGFFEVAPRLKPVSGNTEIWATRFHQEKPVVFSISANTPKEYQQAVRDGILYWNRYLTQSSIQVVEAPSGVTAPDIDHNVIQWVPFDNAGFAYADAMMDPRTGQILHAQAFITSAFAFSGKKKARALLQQIKSGQLTGRPHNLSVQHHKEQNEGDRINLISCEWELGKTLENSLTGVLSASVSDDRILKASKDYVRAVVAHEVGHLLGLRHNFAGSLTTRNYPLKDRAQIFLNYLSKGEVPDNLVASGSIMDYLPFEEDALVGHSISMGKAELEHDSKAIAALYKDKTFLVNEIAPFCTDSQTNNYVDCRGFDTGSLIEFATSSTQKKFNELPYVLIETFASRKTPLNGSEPIAMDAVELNPEKTAESLFEERKILVKSFNSSSSHFLEIFRTFPVVDKTTEEKLKEKETIYIYEQLERAGGLKSVFSVVDSSFYTNTLKRFEKILSTHFQQANPSDESQAVFSSAEVSTMSERVKLLLAMLPKAFTKTDLEILGKIPSTWKKLGNNKLGQELAVLLRDRMSEYLLKPGGDPTVAEIEIPVEENPKEKEKSSDSSKSTSAWDRPDSGNSEDGSMSVSLTLPQFEPVPSDNDVPNTPLQPKPEAANTPQKPKTRIVTVTLPKFFYPMDTRNSAASLLQPGSEEGGLDWGFQERSEIRNRLKDLLNKSCDCNLEKVKVEDIKLRDDVKPELRRAVTLWFMENKKVLENIKTN